MASGWQRGGRANQNSPQVSMRGGGPNTPENTKRSDGKGRTSKR